MSRLLVFIAALAISMAGALVSTSSIAVAAKPVGDALCAGNTIYIVCVDNLGDIGRYTAETGPLHPAPGLNLLYGGAAQSPATSFNSYRSFTTGTTYTQGAVFGGTNINAYATTALIGTTGIRTTWVLPGGILTPDQITIVQDVNVNGTTFANSNVEVTTSITNTGTSALSLGIRYLWDFQIGGDDGPTFQEGSSGPVHTIEADFAPPTFVFYSITNNDPSTPIYTVLGSATGPSTVTPTPTTPTQLTYGCWPVGFGTAFDYTTTGRNVSTTSTDCSFNPTNDSMVLYWWGRSATQGALSLGPGRSVTERALLFATPPNVPPPFNQTEITTSLSGGSQSGPIITVPAGTQVKDSATLVNATPTAGGNVTYTVYTDAMCTMTFANAGTVPVTNGIVPDSNLVTFNSAGTFYWQAVYSGDQFNSAATSVCGEEQVIVRAGPAAFVTVNPPTATNTVGETHCVTATVTDAFGNPVQGVTVVFAVPTSPLTGASPASGSGGTTDASGTSGQFCFSSSLPGQDVIEAAVDSNGNGQLDVTDMPRGRGFKTWNLPASTRFCEVKVTQGGWIIARNGDRANFGGNAKVLADDTLQGQEEYQDQGPAQPMNLHSTRILAMTCTADLQHATIWGEATIDGSPGNPAWIFRIDVADLGEGGANDSYGIIVSNGYASGQQQLQGGNVQIHKT
jgi:hypothetical protein